MRKLIFPLLVLVLASAVLTFSQGMPGIICSSGAVACVIPGATVTGTGASQVVALPGSIKVGDGSVSVPSYSFSSASNMGFYYLDSSGIEFAVGGVRVFSMSNGGLNDKNGASIIRFSPGTVTGPTYSWAADSTTGMWLNSGSILSFSRSGALVQSFGAGGQTLVQKLVSYNGITTAAQGVPVITAIGSAAAVTSAQSSVATYTVGASDGLFNVDCNVNVTTSTVHSFGVVVTYTDETNTPRSLTVPMSQLAGSTVAAITNATGVGPYEGVKLTIRAKAGTAITITTSGTFTTVTYNVYGSISQIQ